MNLPKPSPVAGAPFMVGSTAMRYVEKPESAGFRLVGNADDIAPRAVQHRGWFLYDEGDPDETARGVVYRLPSKGGRARYVAGYQLSYEDDAAALNLNYVFTGDQFGGEDDARDAAMHADGLAQTIAEQERDYHRAWQAGSLWSDLGERIGELRRGIIAAVQQFREARKTLQPDGRASWTGIETGKAMSGRFDALCAIIRSDIADDLAELRKARRQREELADSVWGAANRAAFNDGAGWLVFP